YARHGHSPRVRLLKFGFPRVEGFHSLLHTGRKHSRPRFTASGVSESHARQQGVPTNSWTIRSGGSPTHPVQALHVVAISAHVVAGGLNPRRIVHRKKWVCRRLSIQSSRALIF